MNNKYKDYSDKEFKYSYPISWKKRNKNYLKKREDRKIKENSSILSRNGDK